MTNRARLTFQTSAELNARLDNLARRTRRSKSSLTNAAVERYLAEEEDFKAEVEAAIAEADSGNLVAHEEAANYLRALGKENPLPVPVPRRV